MWSRDPFLLLIVVVVCLAILGAVLAAISKVAEFLQSNRATVARMFRHWLVPVAAAMLWVLPVPFWNGWVVLVVVVLWGVAHWFHDPDRTEDVLRALGRIAGDIGMAVFRFVLAWFQRTQISANGPNKPIEARAPLSFLKESEKPPRISRRVLAALALIVVAAVVVPSACDRINPFGKSRDELQAENKELQIDLGTQVLENNTARVAIDGAEETLNERVRVERVVAQTERRIDDAVLNADFDALAVAYSDGYRAVWMRDEADGPGGANPSASGLRGMQPA